MYKLYLVLGVYGGVPNGGVIKATFDDAVSLALELTKEASVDDDIYIYQFEPLLGAELVEVNGWEEDSEFREDEE